MTNTSRIQRIPKSVPAEDKRGNAIPGIFRQIVVIAVLDVNLRETLYEASHDRDAERWLKEQLIRERQCTTCEE